jgi:hypothetical protein
MNKTPSPLQSVVEEDEFYSRHLDETPEERAQRLYAGKGGPLVSWLLDEAHRRQQTYRDMAYDLQVTYGYINQLRSGLRSVENISHEFAKSCALYLGVPTIVVKLIAGNIRMSDFGWPSLTEEEVIDRAYRRMASDPSVKPALPAQADVLTHAAKKALVMMYSDASGVDLLGARQLPDIVHWLQRAAVLRDAREGEAMREQIRLADYIKTPKSESGADA